MSRWEDLEKWLADVDALLAEGLDPFLAIVDGDPRKRNVILNPKAQP